MSKSTFGQALQALNLIHAKDPTAERLTALYSTGLLSDLLDADPTKINREAFRASLVGCARARSTSAKKALLTSAALDTLPGTKPFLLTVEYAPLEQLIASGQYDWRNGNITSARFPIKGKGTVVFEARHFHFGSISSEKAVAEMKAAGWSPAEIVHLLALGAQHLDEQRKHPIVALGSVAGVLGGRRVPYLDGDASRRNLDLYWWGSAWFSDYRFLAVRLVSAT